MTDSVKCSHCGKVVERKDAWMCVKTKEIICRGCVSSNILIGPGKWEAIKGIIKREKLSKRRTERLEGDEWKPIPFYKIKKGDTFRLFDDVDDPVEVGKPYKAICNAFSGPNGIYIVYIEEYRNKGMSHNRK